MAVVLCVDDEPHILSALRRALRAPDLNVLSANSGDEALALLTQNRVDLVLSDMRMPGMNGAQLLGHVQQVYPDVVRVLLTGHADMGDTIAAINQGNIYRYLQKPWDEAELRSVVRQGLERRSLTLERARLQALTESQNLQLRDANQLLETRVAQRTQELATANDHLKRTHLTAIQVFSNLLELRGDKLVGHGRRVADMARRIGRDLGLNEEDLKELVVAGLLHDIGLIAVPDIVLRKSLSRMTDEETQHYRHHTDLGQHALMALEEMQSVAAIIRAHHERFDGRGYPDGQSGADIPMGARIIAVADVFDDLQIGQLSEVPSNALDARQLIKRAAGSQFDPQVVDAFLRVTEPEAARPPTQRAVSSSQLQPGMVLATDLVSSRGMLMLSAGHVLSEALIPRIREFEKRNAAPFVLQVRNDPVEQVLPAKPVANPPS